MAKTVLTDVDVVLNSVNFSDHVDSVSMPMEWDEVESSAFGDDFKTYERGLPDVTITLNFHQDFAAGEVDATLHPLAVAGTTFPVVIKPTSAAVSATNPTFTMTGRLFNYSPLEGSLGDLSTTEVEIRNAGTTGLVRATS